MKVNDTKTLGQLIRQRRKELGHTQQTISEYTGFSTSFISDVENGKRTVEIDKTIFLMNSLGIDFIVQYRGSKTEL